MQRGQSTLEYAVVIACIAGALLAMKVYIRRSIQGKLRSAADEIGQQYDPGNTTSAAGMTTSITSNVTTEVRMERKIVEGEEVSETTTTSTINSQEEKVYGTENVGALGSSL